MKKIRTHYDNLKVSRDAPPEVIHAAYIALSRKYELDGVLRSPDAEKIKRIIDRAYETLSDSEKRKEHDFWILNQESAFRGDVNFDSDVFNNFDQQPSPGPADNFSSKNPSADSVEDASVLRKFFWLLVLAGAFILKSSETNLEFAFGYSLISFVSGLIIAPIWWLLSKLWRQNPWRWFDWLNAAAIIGIILRNALFFLVQNQMSLLG